MKHFMAVGFIALVGASPYSGWLGGSDMPKPSGPVMVHDKPCPFAEGALACAKGRHVWSPSEYGQGLFLHEVGHVFGTVEVDGREERRFMRSIGWPGPWRDYSRPTWLRASELFAETWSRCARQDLRPIKTYEFLVPLQCELAASFKEEK